MLIDLHLKKTKNPKHPKIPNKNCAIYKISVNSIKIC